MLNNSVMKFKKLTEIDNKTIYPVKPVTDEQVFYDKFLCDKFYLPVCVSLTIFSLTIFSLTSALVQS